MPSIKSFSDVENTLFDIASEYAKLKGLDSEKITRIKFKPTGAPIVDGKYHQHILSIHIGGKIFAHQIMCGKVNDASDFEIQRETTV